MTQGCESVFPFLQGAPGVILVVLAVTKLLPPGSLSMLMFQMRENIIHIEDRLENFKAIIPRCFRCVSRIGATGGC